MILTKSEIIRQYDLGTIVIDPYKEQHVGPNSYDLTLSPYLLKYQNDRLDMKCEEPTYELHINEREGLLLIPNTVYIAMTNEKCGSDIFVTCIEGRSSVARLGIQIHLTAGFGDLGFKSNWTLEMKVAQPVVVYPNVRICQASFHVPHGTIGDNLYKGKYQDQPRPTASKLYKDFLPRSLEIKNT